MSKIFDIVKAGVVTGSEAKKIFQIAKKNKFAIPAINCINTDSINAVLETASKMKAPVIIQFSYTGSKFFIGYGLQKVIDSKDHSLAIHGAILGAFYIHKVSKLYKVPVILHTDHCSKNFLPWIDGLLDEGKKYFLNTGKPLFSSHMIDMSSEPLLKNIKTCSRYLFKFHKINMFLEFELGCTGGEEDGIDNSKLDRSFFYTNPKEVNYAWEKLYSISPNFIIAASFGNIHGVYNNNNIVLNPKILHESQKYISMKHKIPYKKVDFVFHGGSGSSVKDIKEAINYGVIKMNIDTDVQWANWLGVFNFYKKNKLYLQKQIGNINDINHPNKKYYDPRSWIRHGQNSIIIRLEKTFKDLNCVNVL